VIAIVPEVFGRKFSVTEAVVPSFTVVVGDLVGV
jgi:hypothetical protein